MNEPALGKYSPDESLLTPFVEAAKTQRLRSACDLLFINGKDLAWADPKLGLFLAGVEIGENFEEIAEVADARLALTFIDLISRYLPQFMSSVAEKVADTSSHFNEPVTEEQKRLFMADLAQQFAGKEQWQLDDLIPRVLAEWSRFAGGVTSWLARGATHLRQRQRAITGMTDEEYDGMLYALESFGLCENIARVAYPYRGFHSELSLTSGTEFTLTGVNEDAQRIEVFRLNPELARLKSKDGDHALPIFIASYINKHHAGPRRAFACAQYGESSDAEFDVLIPSLEIGFEVKLYQTPFAQKEETGLAKKLDSQVSAYRDIGCKEHYYVSNLSKSSAESVVSKLSSDFQVIPIASGVTEGTDELLSLLDEIVRRLDELRDKNFELELQGRVNKKRGGESHT